MKSLLRSPNKILSNNQKVYLLEVLDNKVIKLGLSAAVLITNAQAYKNDPSFHIPLATRLHQAASAS